MLEVIENEHDSTKTIVNRNLIYEHWIGKISQNLVLEFLVLENQRWNYDLRQFPSTHFKC